MIAAQGFLFFSDVTSQWVIPGVLFFIILIAYGRKVKVYEAFIDGAKEGFDVAVMIIPYLVAILFAIATFRAGGGERAFSWLMEKTGIPDLIGMPASILPLAMIRPLSGSGSRGVLLDIFASKGPDSFDALVGSTLMGSTETTFYVLAVYFGAVGVRRTRHAVIACLCGDIVGILASVLICQWFFAGKGLG
jgi:spore maturation protein B